ncbi:hypothetical protein ACFO8O_00785 [Hephaestia sp. GCM10023244]|uniref:hypothetical protein n=1 Tax=unclassified Hephaestia TaxID=2631281 RepID=UPI0020777680|nr:hypothetical protein [Hephaestia sp. MAHUQ-44]MCM8729503.1 hypothetical protein [Hephaestia sp. MAHUQ-44]
MWRSLILLTAVAPLAACGSNDGPGTTISINGTDGDGGGNVTARADGVSGKVSVALPGFSGELKLPKMHLDAKDFDLNGVPLYPGSQIANIAVDAKNGNGGVVTVDFDSPAAPATVRDWFKQRLEAAGFALTATGDNLVGTTDEGKPFRLTLAPAASDHATGKIVVSG